jgi:chromosome segregation ATPase
MPIEILYIIPILAVAFLIYRLVLNAQKRTEAGGTSAPAAGAGAQAGDTRSQQALRSTEDRLNEYEQTIAQINRTLSIQQKVVEKFQEENTSCTGEIEKLNSQLRELHKEYDIVISENFSLRAKAKSLQRKLDSVPGSLLDAVAPAAATAQPSNGVRETMEMNLNLYEDTKLLKSSSLLDDTTEFDETKSPG